MSWYNTQGPLCDHVLFSRVRYVRNIAKQSFYPLIDQKRGAEVTARLDAILSKSGFHSERVAPGVSAQILSLSEKQFVSRDFVYSEKPRALYLNEPCNMIVSVGGDNYISISSVVSGAAISEARNMAAGAEELIDREIAFAYLEVSVTSRPIPLNAARDWNFPLVFISPLCEYRGFSPLFHTRFLLSVFLSVRCLTERITRAIFTLYHISPTIFAMRELLRNSSATRSCLLSKRKKQGLELYRRMMIRIYLTGRAGL